jgi:hypothetical protein
VKNGFGRGGGRRGEWVTFLGKAESIPLEKKLIWQITADNLYVTSTFTEKY